MSEVVSAYDLFASNENLETNGVWIDLGPMRFKIARAGGQNDDFIRAAAKRFKPFQAAIANGSMPKQLSKDILVELYTDHIVKGWENVYGRDKAPLEFNKANVKHLLSDLPDLLVALQSAALELANFQEANREAAAGN